MKKEIIKTGKTIEEAIELACQELNVDKNEVSVEVLEIPKKGFLGLGQVEAKVKVLANEKSVDKAEVGRQYLSLILENMGIDSCEIETNEVSGRRVIFDLKGDDLALVIGKRGETLNALQSLCSLAANKSGGEYYNIIINVGNYRETREQVLKDLASKISSSVLKRGRKITLEPMSSYERKIIHETIQNIEGVESASKGVDPHRHIVVYPSNSQYKTRDFSYGKHTKRMGSSL